ncbi:hypothetical protein VI817_005925 [Penicillium citrinum]|nr:hypothetical protein VI817_005925 [Penicillium citrinum]
MERIRVRTIILIISSLATVILTTLLALAIYVNVARPVVGKVSTPGFPAININASQWNIACAVLGTALGILVTAGLAYDDGLLTRRAILSKDGVAPFYLRPLTISRGMDQISNGWSNGSRMLLLLLTIVATLSTTATVAIFGVHNVEHSLLNPAASWPLAPILETELGGLWSSPPGLKYLYDFIALDNLLFRAAYSQGLRVRQEYSSETLSTWFPESGTLGDTLYPTMYTGGIGLNISSYLDYSGKSRTGFDVPATYTFNELHGKVFGTHINVKCTNASYTVNKGTINSGVFDDLYEIRTDKGVKIEFAPAAMTVTVGSALVNHTGVPILTIAIPFQGDVLVTECTYSGNEYTAFISLNSRASPIKILEERSNGSSIDNYAKWTLARSMYSLLSVQGGGSLARGWQASKFFPVVGENDEYSGQTVYSTMSLIENITALMGEASISLYRQDIEKANYYHSDALPAGSSIIMSVTVSNLGGGSWPWLSVYILLLVGSLMSLYRCCKRGQILQNDVQDPLRILEITLEEKDISPKSRIRFNERLEVLSSSIGLLSHEDSTRGQKEGADDI